MADGLAEFTSCLPAWVGPDGFPLSWKHYLHGTQYLNREHSRAMFRNFDATLMAGAKAEDRKNWVGTITLAAGWDTDG